MNLADVCGELLLIRAQLHEALERIDRLSQPQRQHAVHVIEEQARLHVPCRARLLYGRLDAALRAHGIAPLGERRLAVELRALGFGKVERAGGTFWLPAIHAPVPAAAAT